MYAEGYVSVVLCRNCEPVIPGYGIRAWVCDEYRMLCSGNPSAGYDTRQLLLRP